MTDKEKLFEEMEAKIKAFTEAHKDEDPEEIINICRGKWWPEESVDVGLEEAANKVLPEGVFTLKSNITPEDDEDAYSYEQMIEMFSGGANWQKEQMLKKACDAYCQICGHYPHSVPTHICRHDCQYYTDFRKAIEQ